MQSNMKDMQERMQQQQRQQQEQQPPEDYIEFEEIK